MDDLNNQGTIDGAAAAFGNINMDTGASAGQDGGELISFDEIQGRLPQGSDARLRDEVSGRYTREQLDAKPTEAKQPLVDPNAAPPADPKAPDAKVVDASDMADEFFEIPGDNEGDEPKRVPASEVFAGYQERETLRAELQKMRESAPPPDYWDREMLNVVDVQGRLEQVLQTQLQMMQPEEPDPDLLNPMSPRHDPTTYYQQKQLSDAMYQRVQHTQQQLQAVQADRSRNQQALMQAAFSREQGKLRQMWPEVFSQPSLRREVGEFAARTYGITNEDFARTPDVRLYALLRDAKAFHDGKAKQQQAAKIVRGKGIPKLVRGQARNPDAQNRVATDAAMRRVSQTGNTEDAASALRRLGF